MSIKKNDILYGLNNEISILELLKSKFGDTILKTIGKYNTIDFEGDNIKIELKSRRNASYTYPTTMIGHRKITSANNSNIKYYYVFKFTDMTMYCEYNEIDFKTFEIKQGGRYDRGRVETDNYIYIPISYLQQLI